MIFRSFSKDEEKIRIYAIEISREEIERTPFTEIDQKFFQSCSSGPVSRQILGISILAKKIEDHETLDSLRKELKWKPTSSEDGDQNESGQS